jgi:hypothetical protein
VKFNFGIYGVEQLKDAKDYQELLFNGMFSKLLTRASKVPGVLTTHKTLALANLGDLWDRNKMYLLLPLRTEVESAQSTSLQIEWRSVIETATAAQKFRAMYTDVDAEPSKLAEVDISKVNPSTPACPKPGHLKVAFGVEMKLSDVVDTVVLTIHTGMIYIITKIHKKNANAAFPELKEDGKENEGPKFSSYCDYFAQK